jgi:predicted Zn-dependent protease with MMP-like domain
VIRETLWHEIAHYFRFSEDEMDRIEDFWAGEG